MVPLFVHLVVNVCVFVPERGKGERVQCRNQLLAELFMGRCFGPSNLRKPLLKARFAKKTGYILKTIYFRTQCQSYSNKGDIRQSQTYLCVRELILYVSIILPFSAKRGGKVDNPNILVCCRISSEYHISPSLKYYSVSISDFDF